VTERKLAEEALRASEERFRSLVQNVNDLIAVVDDDGVLRYVSPSIASMLGFRPEELLGRTAPEQLHPDDLPELQGAFNRARSASGSPVLTQTRARHRDGSWRWLELSITDLSHEPSVAGLVITARDISERKRAEDQLVHQAGHARDSDVARRGVHPAHSPTASRMPNAACRPAVPSHASCTAHATAMSVWLVQTFDDAFSRRMSCSRVRRVVT